LEERTACGLLGVACGDALGLPVEFIARGALRKRPVTDMRGNGTHNQPPGTWSDDTSLTLCVAESLIGGFNLDDMGRRFVAWRHDGYWTPYGVVFDSGKTTTEAIERIARGVPATEAGGTDEWDNGNGSLMRILPVALRFRDAPLEELLDKTHQVSAITHAHPRSKMACGLYVCLARYLLQGRTPFDAYITTIAGVGDWYRNAPDFADQAPHFALILNGDIVTLSEDEIKSDGYVVHTVEASIWCLLTSSTFEETALKAVNLGGDSDTTGAVAGGLAGLAYGVDAIPESWVTQLARASEIRELARVLSRA
jgi:ADP-ribosylglycohydrolase